DRPEFSAEERTVLSDIKVIVSTLALHHDESISGLASVVRLRLMDGCLEPGAASSKSLEQFRSAIKELGDELLPIRAHGMSVLRGLVLAKDPVASEHLDALITIFLDFLHDEDSFIYLNAIKGCSALAEMYPRETIGKMTARYRNPDFYLEDRLRVGESLLQIIQRLGEAIGKEKETICQTIMVVLRDTHPKMQSSAIILCSQITRQVPDVLVPFLYQLFDYILGLLQFQTELEPRRGKCRCANDVIGCLVLVYEVVVAFGFRLPTLIDVHQIARLKSSLETIAYTNSDLVSQGHAESALAMLQQLFLHR
ncbi:transmembrane and coiled-coil domains-containing protein 7, partial [Kappamyces sp. JEL0680]